MKRFFLFLFFAAMLLPARAQVAFDAPSKAQFFEAENFEVQGGGWQVVKSGETMRASLATSLTGSVGDGASTATQKVEIPRAGKWRVWVRYVSITPWRGPFEMDVVQGEKVLATKLFDETYVPGVADWDYRWDNIEVELQPGTYTVRLRKHEQKGVIFYARTIDAILLTDDLELVPDHSLYGPQTWIKVTLGDGYEKPVHVHVWSVHYREPVYTQYALTKGHLDPGILPTAEHAKDALSNGESTGWLNISSTVYQDSGAVLSVYPQYGWQDNAKTFKGTIEFANKPSDDAIVKKIVVDYTPSTITILVPPNLESAENIAKLQSDLEVANKYGEIADNYEWPKTGKKPVKFPFFVAASINPHTTGNRVVERALKTLSNFGFNGIGDDPYFEKFGYNHKTIGAIFWHTKGSYSAPDTERISKEAAAAYESQTKSGVQAKDVAYAFVMDEPGGEPLASIVNDQASIDGFRAWMKSMNLTPQELLVNSWDEVKLVTAESKDKFPALYYYSEKYRTVALGNFIALHKQEVQKNWKSDFPVVANFIDGAVYSANFYSFGIDYFTLLHDTDQNAIMSEDWSNFAATFQHAPYNVDLMRAAARKKNQTLVMFLIAYKGRTGYDIRLKTVSEAARGVKVFNSFAYGPVWSTFESAPWQESPQVWGDHAKVVREIGAVEDDLLPAMPQKAQVAILYSSASDVWNQANSAYGFERMNTWLALSHAQIPVDIVGEGDVADAGLSGYKVCYLADPHITRAAATKLAAWVQAGGTLIMTAGAGEYDEYNRPLDTLNKLLPYQRNAVETLQNYAEAGVHLTTLSPKDTVIKGDTQIDVLSVKQTFANIPDAAQVKRTFKDGSPAEVRSAAGKGFVVSQGYLPSIDYMRKALVAKGDVSAKKKSVIDNNGIPSPNDIVPFKLGEKSYNPWEYPADVRNAIIAPVQAANVQTPIKCSVPLVDAVYMTGGKNLLIPLANYTLQPIQEMTLEIAVDKPVKDVTSVYQGNIKFEKLGANKIRVKMPLDCTDFLTIR